jgi:hypothetical protein
MHSLHRRTASTIDPGTFSGRSRKVCIGPSQTRKVREYPHITVSPPFSQPTGPLSVFTSSSVFQFLDIPNIRNTAIKLPENGPTHPDLQLTRQFQGRVRHKESKNPAPTTAVSESFTAVSEETLAVEIEHFQLSISTSQPILHLNT